MKDSEMVYNCHKCGRCKLCNMKFKNRTRLKKHISEEHELEPSDNTSVHNCHEYGKFLSYNQFKSQQCKNNDTLEKHIRRKPPDDLKADSVNAQLYKPSNILTADAEFQKVSNIPIQFGNDPIQLKAESVNAQLYKPSNILTADAEFQRISNEPIQLKAESVNTQLYKPSNNHTEDSKLQKVSNTPIQFNIPKEVSKHEEETLTSSKHIISANSRTSTENIVEPGQYTKLYIVCSRYKIQNVCTSNGQNDVEVELQNTNGSILQPSMPRKKLYKTTCIILHWRWVKFSHPNPHTLANSTAISQSIKSSMTNQNYPYSKSMLQWPTIETATLDNSKNKIKQTILQWPKENLATPPKNPATPPENIRQSQYTSMLQWPTIKNTTLDKSKNKRNRRIISMLQWPEKNLATPQKARVTELNKTNEETMKDYWVLEDEDQANQQEV